MRRRLLSFGGALVAAAAAASLASIHLTAQAPTCTADTAPQKAGKAAKAWTPPRTADGQPDLTGNWSNATYTPLERPVNLGDKAFFTKEEAEAFARQRVNQFNSQASDDIHYDNAIWQNESYNKGLSTLRTSLITDPPDGRLPALTVEARTRVAGVPAIPAERRADGYQTRTLAERCITWGNEGPPLMPAGYNANLDIYQGPGFVVIRNEMIHNARIIPIDARPHIGPNIRQWNGDSRGHWEGQTLVVDSTNFNDKVRFRSSTRALHVVERFTRADADTIDYSFTVDDPATWTRPWSAEVPMTKIQGPVFEYACHEGNYGLANILRAARVEDTAAAARAAEHAE